MGAFITGLIGRAEQQRDKEEAREFQEAKQERDRKRQLVDLAAQQAIQTGQYQALPSIFGELDELGPPPGTPKGMKDPYKQLGVKIGGLLGMRRKQQQLQQRNQQADQMYTQVTGAPPPGVTTPPFAGGGIPGVSGAPASAPGAGVPPTSPPLPVSRVGGGAAPTPTALPGPDQGQTAAPPPMRPRLQQFVGAMQQAKEQGRTEQAQQGERGFQTSRYQEDVKAEDTEKRKEKTADALTKYFEAQGIEHKAAREQADLAVFGKSLAPPKPNVKEIPNIKGDAYGHPGETGTLEMDLATGKETFRPTAAKPGGAGRIFTVNRGGHKLLFDAQGKQIADLGAQDEPLSWKPVQVGNKLYYAPYSTRTHAQLAPPQPELPEGEKATGEAQTSGRTQTPPMPSPRKPVAAQAPGGGVSTTQPPAGLPRGARYGGEKFTAQDKALMERAQTVMQTGVDAAKDLETLAQQHPNWFGPMAGRITDIRKRIGVAPPEVADMLAKIHSVQNFLPSMHGLRGKYPLEAWEKVLQDPFVNPQATAAAIRGALKAVEEYRRNIQTGDFEKPINLRDMEGPPPSNLNPYR